MQVTLRNNGDGAVFEVKDDGNDGITINNRAEAFEDTRTLDQICTLVRYLDNLQYDIDGILSNITDVRQMIGDMGDIVPGDVAEPFLRSAADMEDAAKTIAGWISEYASEELPGVQM